MDPVREAQQRVAHVAGNGHLPDPEAEVSVCPNCGYSFGGEIGDNFTPEEPPASAEELMSDFAAALRRSGRY